MECYKKVVNAVLASMNSQDKVAETKLETSEFERNCSTTKILLKRLYSYELEISEKASLINISIATGSQSSSINSKKSTQSQLNLAISEKEYEDKIDEIDAKMRLIQLETEKNGFKEKEI